MARVKLALPDKFHFETEISVRIGDVNYGGHLGNDSVLSMVHESRVRLLDKHGYSELDVCGCGMIQSDAVIIYKSEAFYGDLITIKIAVDDFSSFGCDFLFVMNNKGSGKEVARGKTGIVFYDYKNKKLMRVPEEFKAFFI